MTGDCNRIIYNILLEYGSGRTLADLIKKSGGRGLSESDVRCYTRHILEGLDCVHSSGYVHRALKPENIIIVSISTGTGTKYVAKDVGCIVFEMLTGKSVWDGKQDSKVEDILSDISKGHRLLKLPNESEMLLNHHFVVGLGEDSENNEEELSVENSEEKDERELKVKKLKLDAETIMVCSSLSYEDSAVEDEISSSCRSDDWSNMPLEAEELQDIVEPRRVDWSLSLSVQY
ncbi:serine/threonine-protein kinase 17B-like [Camellia sinensis]|uniref:serine/threonine-protein kinase 17B-like n=1 Tax=Camellia sinensis TaxID=4442 RepID=UPI0010364F4C|nr:serine/threonine-protein kinase 17B-like [Camellia sinensis]